ncbi:uncharacterized protein LOC8285333 isoform X2 [Ricinus communis]|uniref:uncharacterized protein LOC8285333 isoform X2 n=1 Tax=Ricinus communis TaxID=3988 RepID=UPI00201AB69F|nr:uncharacterized protein LOC8285333 isoform X2 [Ricinus communis]
MSDRIVQSDHDKDNVPDKSMKPFQSAWMSHWTHSRYRPIDDAQNQLSLPSESGKNTQRCKRQNSLGETEFETGLRKLRHETSSKGQQFPMFKSSHNRDGIVPMKNGESSSPQEGLVSSQMDPSSRCDVSLGQIDKCLLPMHESAPSKRETQTLETHFEHEGITSNLNQQVKSNKLLEDHKFFISESLKDEFLGSTSGIVPSKFNSGRTPIEPFFPRQDFINQPNSISLVHERKINNNATLLTDDPSTSNNRLRNFLGEQVQKMPNHSDIKLFDRQVRLPDARLYHGSYELPTIPPSVQDVETMKMCTTIGSLEEYTICPPKFSQTTHHFLITKKTDVNLFDGGQTFRGSTISTKFKGKRPSGLLTLSPDLAFNVKQGVKLQSLDSSTDSEAKENIENIHTSAVNLKNESSAETDTMDMDTLRVNHLSGGVSSIPNKDINGAQKSQKSEAAIDSVREGNRGRLPNIELPDINQEVTAIPGVTSSADDGEASTSRTQSLNVEQFLSHVEDPTNSISSASVDIQLGLDPYSRWVKRLKPSSSDSFAHGTKSLKMAEASSHEKVNKLFSKILNHSKTSSEPKMNKSHGKQHMVVDQTSDLLRNIEASSAVPVRKIQEATLSHAWIRRWCHNQAALSKAKPEGGVVCEPQNSTANQDNFQKKQFPSLAAMALMGKAMNGFHPCKFRKMGSFIVWNNKGLK